jgi:hypothetical protein
VGELDPGLEVLEEVHEQVHVLALVLDHLPPRLRGDSLITFEDIPPELEPSGVGLLAEVEFLSDVVQLVARELEVLLRDAH